MSGPVVEVKQGKLQGKTLNTKNGKVYHSFSGIPYAEPPVGKLRFKDPVSIGPWSGIRDASNEGSAAMQYQIFGNQLIGSEDCLYLNVHTPIINTLILLPVMLFIHGGGFIYGSGSSEEFGPEYLIEQDVVMVNINYRLGVLGFLCTDSVNATGDMGLKDQNLAMRWVKDNIKNFGGDPDNITIFGISAGAASVEYQILSPRSRNLFHRAIMQSGSVLNPWARLRGGVNYTERFARTLGYKPDGGQGLFEFINSFDSKTLVENANKELKLEDHKEGYYFSFVPVVNELEGYDGFLNEEPIEILRKGSFTKVPMISGLCSNEGLLMKWLLKDLKQSFNQSDFFEFTPTYLKHKNLEQRLIQMYSSNDEKEKYVEFLSDLNFNGGVLYSLDQRLKHNTNNEFFYLFNYDGGLNLFRRMLNYTYSGPAHGDDTYYIGSLNFANLDTLTAKDINVKDTMVKMWTSFAKIGNPTPQKSDLINIKWEPIVKEQFKYLEIGEKLTMYKDYYTPERRSLWVDIYSRIKNEYVLLNHMIYLYYIYIFFLNYMK